MKAKCLVASVMMGLGLSTVGCLQSATDEDLAAMDLEAPQYAPQENPTGGGTTNGIKPTVYQEHKYELLAAMDHALGMYVCFYGACGYTDNLSTSIYDTHILDTEEGRGLFKVAIQCALADGQSVYDSSERYTGKGLMLATDGWFSGALSDEQKEDVFRCVVARVNASGLHVDIVISGEHVKDQPGGVDSKVDWQPDALFDVRIDRSSSPPTIREYAWPLAHVNNDPSLDCRFAISDIEARVCDSDRSKCGFVIGYNPLENCYGYRGLSSTRSFRCAWNPALVLRPVVESWVDPSSWHIFSSCGIGLSIDNMIPENIPEAR